MIVVYIIGAFISLLFYLLVSKASVNGIRPVIRGLSRRPVCEDLCRFTDPADIDRKLALYYKRKLKILLSVIFAGCILCIITELALRNKEQLIDKDQIMRNEIGGSSRNVSLWATDEATDERVRLDLTVSEQKYNDEALDGLYAGLSEILPSVITGENPSPDNVVYDLCFPEAVDGFPFTLSYRSLDPLLLDRKGKIDRDRLRKREGYENGILVNIIVTSTYEDYKRELSFYVRLYDDPERTEEDKPFKDALTEAVNETEETSRSYDRLILPGEVGNDRVTYEEVSSYKSLFILILSICTGILLYKREDEELKKKTGNRNEQMLTDYPAIINKFSLFYSVGMTTRGILLKLCRDYEIKREAGMEKRYAYEEMIKTRQRLEEGTGECMAYEEFGKRCALHKYRQLSNLMEQSVLKGRNDAVKILEEEAKKAFTERKNRARELGEKAGTKLLLPMFLMLFTVIVIIIIPAMSAFQM